VPGSEDDLFAIFSELSFEDGKIVKTNALNFWIAFTIDLNNQEAAKQFRNN